MISSIAASSAVAAAGGNLHAPVQLEDTAQIASPKPLAATSGGALAAPASALAAQEEGNSANPNELTEEEQAVVDRLKKRDQEVRNHESAHASAGGPFTSAATFVYQRGPDGRLYAIGGEVKIDVSAAGTPEATVQKAETIKRAALAPADPSSQDRAVAAAAEQLKEQAEGEIREKEEQEKQEIEARNEARRNGENPHATPEVSSAITDVASALNGYNQAANLLGG